MTKSEFIDGIIEQVKRIPTLRDKSIHESVISNFISRAFNQMLGELTSKGYKNLSLLTRLCIGADNTGVSVQKNNATGVYYSVLPYDISPLTDVRSGVRGVAPMDSLSVEFHPIDRSKIATRLNQLSSQVSGEIFYTPGIDNLGRNTVDYIGMNDDNAIEKVKMYLLLPFDAYGEDDVIHIPAGQDKSITDNVVSMLLGQTKDMLNFQMGMQMAKNNQ